MHIMKKEHLLKSLLLLTIAIAIVIAVLPLQICRDWAFICENTGSHKGYREWSLGFKTGHRYRASPLEEFIQTNEPTGISHRWTSYAGTGRNIFGRPGLRGHGQPGAIIHLKHDILKQWIEKNDAIKVHQLYDVFVSNNQTEIDGKIKNLFEEVMQ